MNTNAARLKQLLDGQDIVVAPGAYDALTARMIQDAGFSAVYQGGFTSSIQRGIVDALDTMTARLESARRIVDLIEIPLVVDVENGFGATIHLTHTIRSFDRAGIAGVQLDDEPSKHATYHTGANLEVYEESVALDRIRCALDARLSDDFIIMARTDLLRVTGDLDQTIDRSQKMFDAGAHIIQVVGITNVTQARALVAGLPGVPLVYVGGLESDPEPTMQELQDLGYRMALFSYLCLWGMLPGVDEVLQSLRVAGVSGIAEASKPHLRKRMHELIRSHEQLSLEAADAAK